MRRFSLSFLFWLMFWTGILTLIAKGHYDLFIAPRLRPPIEVIDGN